MKYQCYFFLLLLLLTSCDKDKVLNEEDKKATLTVISAYAERGGKPEMPDINAKVFVFYDHVAEDFFKCDIHADGTVTKEGTLVMTADIKGATNIDGKVVFDIDKKDSFYMVFVMSNKCTGKMMGNFQHDSNGTPQMTFLFHLD